MHPQALKQALKALCEKTARTKNDYNEIYKELHETQMPSLICDPIKDDILAYLTKLGRNTQDEELKTFIGKLWDDIATGRFTAPPAPRPMPLRPF